MDRENINHLTDYMDKVGYSHTDIKYILTAYTTSYRLYKENQIDNDPGRLKKQYSHLIQTSLILAEQFLDTDTLAAALMHDLIYTCNIKTTDLKHAFSDTVIHYLEGMNRFHDETMDYLQGKVTKSSQELINTPIDPHVVLISAAKRIARLNSILYIRTDEVPYYLDNTNDLLIKLVKKEGSRYFTSQLSECWLRCSDRETYSYYEERYRRLLAYNEDSAKETIAFLKNAFFGRNTDMPNRAIKHTKYISSFHHSNRLIHSIYTHIKSDDRQVRKQPFSKWDVPLYDCTLVFDNSASKNGAYFLLEEFLNIFKYYLSKHYFTIRNYLVTNDNAPYFVIADRWENRYRIFLRTELLFRRYQIGTIADEEQRSPTFLAQNVSRGTVRIIVNNNIERVLPAGYCSIDYAFMISTSFGLNFQRMEINNSLPDLIGDRILKNGDVGVLILSDQITADFSWFNYIETEQAHRQLIEYFKCNYTIRAK